MNPVLFALVCDGIHVVQILPSSNPDWAVAILSVGEHAVLRKRGGTFEGATVVEVSEQSVLLARDGKQCRAWTHVPTTTLPERTITRVELDKILEDASSSRKLRVVPETSDGHVAGVRLFGVRPDEGVARLGLENGDRVETINGYNITQPEKALEAYARLRSSDRFCIHVTRKDMPFDIEIAVR